MNQLHQKVLDAQAELERAKAEENKFNALSPQEKVLATIYTLRRNWSYLLSQERRHYNPGDHFHGSIEEHNQRMAEQREREQKIALERQARIERLIVICGDHEKALELLEILDKIISNSY